MSRETISKITDKVLEGWQTRPLDRVYPVVFIDAMVVKIRDGQVANRPIYTAIGVTVDGKRDILGQWAAAGETVLSEPTWAELDGPVDAAVWLEPAAVKASSVPLGGMRMSVTTTSGWASSTRASRPGRSPHTDQLEVVGGLDQAGDAVSQQDVVLGQDHRDRHRFARYPASRRHPVGGWAVAGRRFGRRSAAGEAPRWGGQHEPRAGGWHPSAR